MRASIFLFLILSMTSLCYAQVEPMATGPYKPNWESLSQFSNAPEWFQDAKFGIWAHWGPQCQPEQGDWYARFMYYTGTWQHNHNLSTYGNPSVFGFKDVIDRWTVSNWNHYCNLLISILSIRCPSLSIISSFNPSKTRVSPISGSDSLV